MKIPEKIIIEGRVWLVKRKWRIVQDGESCDGLCVPETRSIFILHGLPKDELVQVFMHEFLHAIAFEKGMYLTRLSGDFEELFVHSFAKEILSNFTLKVKTPRSK